MYDVEIHSGRSGGGSRKTEFTVNNITKQLESMNNKLNTVLFESITPDNNGIITISFTKSNSSWGYFNGLVITEKPSSNNVRKSSGTTSLTNDFIVYPNPSMGTFTIESNPNWEENSTLVISDLNGQVLISENINLETSYQLDSQLEMGVYMLRLTNNSENFVKQIIVTE